MTVQLFNEDENMWRAIDELKFYAWLDADNTDKKKCSKRKAGDQKCVHDVKQSSKSNKGVIGI